MFSVLGSGRNQRQSETLPLRAQGSWWLDVKLGIRILIKYPALALVGIIGIAVAVSIAAGGFSVVYANFVAPSLPLEEGDRIVSLRFWDSAANRPEPHILRDYVIWRKGLSSIQEIGAFRTITPTLITPGAQPESVTVASISASGFSVARVQPLTGRYLMDSDEREGAPAVVVIGETVWRNRFGSDPAILGQTIQLGDVRFSIVGVMPEAFAFPVNHRFWIPFRTGPALPEPRTGPDITVFGRLAPGATLERAQAELVAVSQAAEFPEVYARLRPQVTPYASPLGSSENETGTGTDFISLLMMNLPATMLLVLVCLNVAILVYARTAMRQGEISVRHALGASRGRIVAQLFTEAFVLSAAGSMAGVVFAALALRQVSASIEQMAIDLPFWVSLQLSPAAVLYAAVLSVLSAAFFGLVPALKATRGGIQSGARIAGTDGSGMKLGGTWTLLVIAQVALVVTLLPAAVFNAWENLRVELADPGFPAEEFLTAKLGMDDIDGTELAAIDTSELMRRYAQRHTDLLRRLEAEPLLTGATFSMVIPGNERGALIDIAPDATRPQTGRPSSGSAMESGETSGHDVRLNRVDVRFFRTLDIPILAGRGFEPADVAPGESGVVVVNQSLAQRIFGGDALGRRIRYSNRNTDAAPQNVESGRWYEIVGIVPDFPEGVSPGMLDSPLKLYHPVAAGQVLPATLELRVRGDSPSAFARRLTEVAADVDPALHVRSTLSLNDALRQEQWIRRLEAVMIGAAALSVLLLSSAGIYALMSFTVSQRRKEIGIRMALGADRKGVVVSIFSRVFAQLSAGIALGVIAASALESSNDFMRGNAAVVLPLMAVFMMAVGFFAALGPARQSLQIEPTEALRDQ